MATKQSQVKQIWFTKEDEQNFAKLGEYLRSIGVDVEPDNRRANDPYSPTKVVRWALQHALESDDNG